MHLVSCPLSVSRRVAWSLLATGLLLTAAGAGADEPLPPTVDAATGQPVYEIPVEGAVIGQSVEQTIARNFGGDWTGNDRSPFTHADFSTGAHGGAAITNVGWPYRPWYGGLAYRPWYSYYQPYYGNAYRSYYRPWYSGGYGGYAGGYGGGYAGVPMGIYSAWPNQSVAPQYGLGALQADIGLFSSGAWAANNFYPQAYTSYYGPYGPWYAGQVAWPQGFAGYTPWDVGAAYGGCFYW